ncbi:MAG: YraN family protein [Actinobacteria bacterium]|nr:YraN family protein [Actinomycetota bacterium]
MHGKQAEGGHNRSMGREGEEVASRYLRRRGYRILERNYRSPFGELDIIAGKAGKLVFCEVKARTVGDAEEALAAVDARRRERMAKAASYYLARERPEVTVCRFDVIALLKKGGKWKIVHVEDAFVMGDL